LGKTLSFVLAAAALTNSEAAGASSSQSPIVPGRSGEFVGAAGCKSSSCHGGAGEKRSQYITWTQQDFHSRAFAVLVNARSARMADTLRIGPAQNSARCTVCHSPFQAIDASRLTSTAHADEGVSCESCHNAAASWFRGHTRSDWTYAMRVTAGMRDLRNLYVRANSCVACHQNLDADVLAAGHPELRFELDGQSIAEPKHWQDPPATGAKAWLVGQAVALRETSWALSRTDGATGSAFPKRNALVWMLSQVTAQQTRLPVISPPGAIEAKASYIDMQGHADALAHSASDAALGADFARQAFQALTNTDAEFRQSKESRDALFCRAERLVPGIYRTAVASGADSDVSPRPEIRQLMEMIQNRESFDARRFADALAAYREAAGSSSGR